MSCRAQLPRANSSQSEVAHGSSSSKPSKADTSSMDAAALSQPLVGSGTFLQSHLMLSACKHFSAAFAQDADDFNSQLCDRLLFTPARPQTSLTGEADARGTARNTLRGDLQCTASAVWQLGSASWNAHLRMLKDHVQSGKLEVVAVFKSRVYDETPLKLRVPTNASQQSTSVGGSKADSCIAKIMQTRFRIGVLVKHCSSGSRLYYKGIVPTILQGLERTRGEDICLSQKQIIDSVPLLDEVAQLAKLSVDASTADRYLANAQAEIGLRLHRPWDTPLHVDCEVHKASTCVTWALRGVDTHVSGLISASLVLRQAGSLASFREHLMAEIESNFLIVHGAAPQGHVKAFRQEVYATFLEGQLAREQDAKNLEHRRAAQKAILDRFLRGDLEQETVQLFTHGVTATEDEVLAVIRQTVIPALLPGAMPTYARHRWMGGEQSVDWIGLIESHHRLFSRTIRRMFRAQLPLPAPADEQFGWDALIEAIPEASEPKPQEEDPDAVIDAMLADLMCCDTEDQAAAASKRDQDWVEFNKSMQKKLQAWVCKCDLSVLALVRAVLSVSSKLLFALLGRSGDKFDAAQQKLLSNGKARTYRMAAAVMGNDVDAAMEAIGAAFQVNPQAIPGGSRTRAHRVTMFARMSGAIEFLLRSLRQVCPYRTSLLLLDPTEGMAADLLDLEPCLIDSVTKALVELYPTPAQLASEEALSILHSTFDFCEMDVAGIECRHASIRHRLDAKNATWDVILQTLSADFLCRQATLQNQAYEQLLSGISLHAGISKTPMKELRKLSRRKKRRPPQKRVGGGGQRAYFHQRMKEFSLQQKREMGHSRMYKKLHAEYRNPSADQQSQVMALGNAAMITARTGARAFMRRFAPKGRSARQTLAIAAPSCMELCADVQEQAQGVVWHTRHTSRQTAQTQKAAKLEEDATVLKQRQSMSQDGLVVSDVAIPCAAFVPTLDSGPGHLRTADWCNPCNDLAKARAWWLNFGL